MKLFSKCLLFIVPTFFIISCGGSDSSSSDLTADEINTISEVLVAAMGDSGGNAGYSASIDINDVDLLVNINSNTYTTTCNGTHYWFTGTPSGTYNCPTSGHVTYSGNLKTYCTTWTYYSEYGTCVCNGDWKTINSMTFQYSDPTNNLYDCDNGGIILDGTVYINVTGTGSVINISMTGTLGINRRGPTGGLVPITSDCRIFLYYTGSTGEWTGTICGYSVSSLSVNTAPLPEF